MPQPVNYICTKCDFKGSSFSTWGKHSYSINDALIPIHRSLSVCYTCGSIVSAEILPSKESVHSLKNSSDALKQMFYEEELERFATLQKRKSPARCLACGSHDFEFIPNVEPDREQRKAGLPIRTGLFHRNCGGRIYAEFRAPNFFMRELPESIYNTEGIKIENNDSELINSPTNKAFRADG